MQPVRAAHWRPRRPCPHAPCARPGSLGPAVAEPASAPADAPAGAPINDAHSDASDAPAGTLAGALAGAPAVGSAIVASGPDDEAFDNTDRSEEARAAVPVAIGDSSPDPRSVLRRLRFSARSFSSSASRPASSACSLSISTLCWPTTVFVPTLMKESSLL
eukprot:scaffold25488_cov64-Phaeocystis_antarctica.AAC.4